MASLSDILSKAFAPSEYSMGGAGLDDEERRLMEELRSKGVYVPQEREVSPWSYGGGTQRTQNLAEIRKALQPAQERNLKEYLWRQNEAARMAAAKEARKTARKSAASEQRSAIKRASSPAAVADRERAAVEQFNRQQKFNQQRLDADRKRRIDAEQRQQYLKGLPRTTPSERYASGEGGSMPFRSEEAYLASNPTPRITPEQEAELKVLQQESLPIQAQEQAIKAQEIANDVGFLKLEDLQEANKLSSDVRAALPQNYAQILADKRVVSDELEMLLSKHRLDVAKTQGSELEKLGADKQSQALELELKSIQAALVWLQNTPEGQTYQTKGGAMGADYRNKLLLLQTQLETAKAQRARYQSLTNPNSNLGNTLGVPSGSSGYIGPAQFGP